MGDYAQAPPYSIQIEPSEGCNLACSFCSMHAIREKGANWKTYKLMEIRTVNHVSRMVNRAGWNPRWEFAMHGEPTLHPQLHKLIYAVRKRLPRAYILLTTNGMPLLWDEEGKLGDPEERFDIFRSKVDRLFKSGCNTIAIDNYAYLKDRVAEVARRYKGVDTVHEYPSGGKDGNPHPRHSGRKLTVVEDISVASSGTHSNLTNQGGTAFEKDYSRKDQRCAKPFREIAVRWDGNVAVCCDSWDGWGQIGNVNDYDNIDDLWQHPRFQAFRKMLYHKGRIMGPCDGCNVRSYRVGLLPDPKGKEDMPKFTKKDKAVLDECLAEGPTTPVVRDEKRPWLNDRRKAIKISRKARAS